MNLWPLASADNLAANKVYHQKVTYQENGQEKESSVMKLIGKFFFIKNP